MESETEAAAPMDASASPAPGSGGGGNTGPCLTWLDAAEVVLKDAGKGMHITDLTSAILDRRLTQSSSKTSLETLLYRETLAGSRRFKRIAGKLGWFGLLTEEERQQVIEREGDDKQLAPSRKRKHTQSESEEEDEDPEVAEIERQRYRLLRRAVKELVFENSALSGQLQYMEEKLTRFKAERRYLLRRLLSYESGDAKPPIITKGQRYVDRRTQRAQREAKAPPVPPPPPPQPPSSTPTPMPKLDYAAVLAGVPRRPAGSASQTPVRGVAGPPPPPALLSDRVPPRLAAASRPLSSSGPPAPKAPSAKERARKDDHHPPLEKIHGKKTMAMAPGRPPKLTPGPKKGALPPPPPPVETPPLAGVGKSKRKKPGMVKKRIQPIPVHPTGLPVFPIVLGGLTVHNLGTVVHDRPTFHSERYIWPSGFSSTRFYPSMKTPNTRTLYTCRIRDNEDAPVFEMIGEDDPENVISAPSATACLCLVLTAVNKARSKEATNTGSGPEFFGFSHPTIVNLIQHLPNAERCRKYNWVEFEPPRKVKDSATRSYGSGVPNDTRLNPIPSSAAAGGHAPRLPAGRGSTSGARGKVTPYKRNAPPVPVYSNPAPANDAHSNSGSGSDSGSSYYTGSSEDESGSGSESDTPAQPAHPDAAHRGPPAPQQPHHQGYHRPQLWQGSQAMRGRQMYASNSGPSHAQFLPQHAPGGSYPSQMPMLSSHAQAHQQAGTGQYESSESTSGSESESSGSGSSSSGSEDEE